VPFYGFSSMLYAALSPGHGALSFEGVAWVLTVEFEVTNCDLKFRRYPVAICDSI